jgi:hypothetical protein
MKGSARNPILDQILSENSSVVLDVAGRSAKVEPNPQLFACRALNTTIIFKLPSFDINEGAASAEGNEWDLASLLIRREGFTQRPIDTGIFIPYSAKDRQAGGVVLYVRQKNFGALVHEFLGLNHHVNDAPTKRDLDILDRIDRIPSLDPFLLKLTLEKQFPDIHSVFYDITEVEDTAVRDTITRKVVPIVRKAVDKGTSEEGGLSRFINAIWDPGAAEAALFVSAFGISTSQTHETFEAWRGISFYEWSYARLVRPVGKLLSWIQSDLAKPTDGQRIGSSMRQQLEALRVSVGKKLSNNARSPDQFFRDYARRHDEFVTKSDPTRFREFLCSAKKSYWELGWSITALTHAIGIFSRAIARGSSGQLPAEVLYELYRDLDLALLKNKTDLAFDGAQASKAVAQ